MEEINNTIDFNTFLSVDIRVGVIREVEDTEGLRISAYRLTIDFGPEIGIKTSLAQSTNYTKEELTGRQILAVVNFKPKKIGKYTSEALILAVPTENKGTALVMPDKEATVGGKLY